MEEQESLDTTDLLGEEVVESEEEEESEGIETTEEEGEGEVEEEEASEEGEQDEFQAEVLKEMQTGDPNEKQIKALQAQLQTLNAQLAKFANRPQEIPEFQTPAVTEEEFNELLQDPEKFNEYVKKVHKQAVADARELVLKESGAYILPQVRQQVEVQMLVEDFFKRNPDLQGKRAEIARLAEHYEDAMPGIKPRDLFKKLDEFAQKVGSKKKSAKGLSSAKGSRKPTRKSIAQAEQDVLDLFE